MTQHLFRHMRRWLAMTICMAIWAIPQPSGAQEWTEPARGSETRAALMDALRPHAEWHLAAPVQFVVHDLRQAGDVAFGSVHAQRPGGDPIDVSRTPGYRRGALDPEFMDGTTLQALYRRVGKTWVAVHWAIGATDVWYAAPDFCPLWGPVLPEICGPR